MHAPVHLYAVCMVLQICVELLLRFLLLFPLLLVLLLLAFLLRSLIKFILGLDFINSSNEGSYFGRLRLLNISLFLLVQKLAELFGIIESISKRQKLLIII